MAIKKKEAVDKLKKQDKKLSKLPSMDKEEKLFRKNESLLSRLLVRKKFVAKKPKIPENLKPKKKTARKRKR